MFFLTVLEFMDFIYLLNLKFLRFQLTIQFNSIQFKKLWENITQTLIDQIKNKNNKIYGAYGKTSQQEKCLGRLNYIELTVPFLWLNTCW